MQSILIWKNYFNAFETHHWKNKLNHFHLVQVFCNIVEAAILRHFGK